MKKNNEESRWIKFHTMRDKHNGIDYTKDNIFDAIGRPDLKPKENGEYEDLTDMKQFKYIPEISSYNNNYYIGFNKDLLFGKSDDDNTTEWWIIEGNFIKHLGYSLTSENDKLHLNDDVLS